MTCKLLILIGWLPGILTGYAQESRFYLKNDLATDRQNESVVIIRAKLESQYGKAGTTLVPVLKYPDGRIIPSQRDDMNGDGRWDELAFVVDVKASSSQTILIAWVPEEKAPAFENKTQVYLARQNPDGSFTELLTADAPVGPDGFPTQYQSEGVGWENDKMAFRVYFDCRNVKDLFGKLNPDLILHKAGTPEFGSYHTLSPWGMDILHCGSSLGAGGLALVEGDSLFRLGSTPVYRYTQITEGPVRTVFELRYQDWDVKGSQYEAVEKITLWLGQYGFQSEVTIGEFTGEKELATGIVTTRLEGDPVQFQANKDYTALFTHGKQSLNNDVLAMAVLAPAKKIGRIGRTGNTDYFQLGYQTVPEKSFSQVISETCYLSQKIKSNTPSVHYFYALWGLENPKWNDAEAVKDYLRREAERISNPIRWMPDAGYRILDFGFLNPESRIPNPESDIQHTMLTAAKWQLEHPKHRMNDWTNGAFYAGLMAAYETTGSKELYQALLDMGEATGWKPGSRLHHADDQVICQTYIDLYRLEKDPKMIQPTVDSINKMMITPYPAKDIQKICWWWCDALFMAPPALVKLGVTMDKPEYLEFNDRLFRETVDLLWNEEDSLFARDLNYVWEYTEQDVKETNGECVFWSRGNGWVMAGLARILKELPLDYPQRDYYLALFKKMAKRIASLQLPDGLWRASLLDPDAYPGGEASGSGFYCYALAWGINQGILDRSTYLPVVSKAWTGLNSLLTPEGYVGWVQPIGADPQKDFSPTSWEVYGTGAFLLAGSEVIKLNGLKDITLIAPARSVKTTLPVGTGNESLAGCFYLVQKNPEINFIAIKYLKRKTTGLS